MIYPEPEARDKIYQYLPTHAKTQNTFILASRNYFDSDMSKSTNTIVYFDWKTGIYIYACGICRTHFTVIDFSSGLIVHGQGKLIRTNDFCQMLSIESI